MSFHLVERNLRDSFRALAAGREKGDVRELPGVSIASLAVAFQMFNSAFLSAPVETQKELDERLRTAREYFAARRLAWSFWVCESWLADAPRRRLTRTFEAAGLRLASEMPGMIAESIRPPRRPLPPLEMVPVADTRALSHFRLIGATCFRVPADWFAEVFDEHLPARSAFPCWVGYSQGVPVATAAGAASPGALGLYNIATLPDQRKRGFGEAITRCAIAATSQGETPVVLQSTPQGLPLYERMGFRAVTRILAFNSR